MISLQQFASAIGCTQMTAGVWLQAFELAMLEFEINTRPRAAAFLAQVGHESGSLGHIEENLNYTAQRLTEVWPRRFPTVASARYYEHSPERLGNLVYANRMGNGAYESGDGWRYHGRGPLQITGAGNYRACGAALGLALIEQPQMLLEPGPGARAAGWFWHSHGCNAAADAGDVETLTHLINGGNLGLADRIARTQQALKALSST